MEVYGSWRVPQLRLELKKRGAKSTGRKEELIDRLFSYDCNNNFQEDLVLNEDNDSALTSTYFWPPNHCFKSVSERSNKNLLNSVHITEYFMKTCDRQEEISVFSLVLRKGYGMMEENFLAAITQAQQDEKFFYQSQVNSEYTKRLTYFCRMIISDEGEILEGSCECVAGAGVLAGCKHLAVTCFAILRFNERGVWQLRKTCTEKQQTWHMPKKQKIDVSPKKTQDLSFRVLVYDVEKKRNWNLIYDPRPQENRRVPSFNDRVRNSVINYRLYKDNRTFGLNGIYGSACISSLVGDHDYLERPLHHQWIYNCIEAFANDADGIEKRTRRQSKSKEWHYIRSLIITASHVGEIVHMTDRRNKEEYAARLVCPKPISTPPILWGRQHENTAKAQFEELSYVKIQPCGLFISKKYPFIGASPDGLICVLTVLEVKCPWSIKDEEITSECLPYLETKNGKLCLRTTSNYYYQVQTQLFVTGRQFCDFVLWTKKDCRRISVERNDNVINKEIIPKVSAFYRDFMVPAITRHYYSL